MKKMGKLFLLLLGVMVSLPIKGYAANESITEQRKAVVDAATAYLNQQHQVQYDSYRKNLYATPEDATSRHIVYTVCSGLTFQAYYQALGIEIPDTTEELLLFAKHNYKDSKYGSYVLAYYDSDNNTTDVTNVYSESGLGTSDKSNYENLLKEWIAFLEPGDLVVYTGHVMFVESVDKTAGTVSLIEASKGSRYDFANHKDVYEYTNESPTLVKSNLLNRLKTRYNLKDIEELAVIRPINADGTKYLSQNGSVSEPDKMTYTEKSYNGVTAAAKSRNKYPNIEIEKIVEIKSDPNQQVSATVGDEMTYKLTIKNNSSSDYSKFNVVEYIDTNVKVIDKGNGTLSGNELKWNDIELKKGETITITYKVEVKKEKSLFGKIIVSEGKVDNIATSRIETYVGNKFTAAEKSKIGASYDKLKTSSSYERDFINDIYKDAFGLDLGLSNKVSNLDIIGYDKNIDYGGKDKLVVKRTAVKNVPVAKYIYNNFYGLSLASKDNAENSFVRAILAWNVYPTYEMNDRAKDLTKDMLDDGDIILLYTNLSEPDGANQTLGNTYENRAYIYLNNKLVRKLSDGTLKEITGDNLDVFLKDIVGDNYIVLRPSVEYGEGISQFDVEVPGKEDPSDVPENKPSETPKDQPVEKNPVTGLLSERVYVILGVGIALGTVTYVLNKKKKYM